MKNKILPIIAVLLVTFATAAPALAEQKWNDKESKFTKPLSSSSSSSNDICTQLFKGDPLNIFREVFCSLINVVALSIADFATDLTCTIQGSGYSANYKINTFTYQTTDGECTPKEIPFTPRSTLTENIITRGPNSTFDNFLIARSIMLAIAVAFLFFLAFASILHINVNTYSVKRALPLLAIAIIGGYLAIYIVFIFSYFADFLLSLNFFSPNEALHPMMNIFGGRFEPAFHKDIIASGAADTGPENSVRLVFEVGQAIISGQNPTFISGLLGSIILVIPAVVVFVFEYVLSLRPFVVQILAVASPFAFACLILPQTQFIFRKWWTILIIAIFYAPLVNFIFLILNSFPIASGVGALALWAVKTAVIVILIRLPFTIESDIRKISVSLARTGFGASLGLSKYAGGKPQTVKTEVEGFQSDKKLESAKAQRVIISGKAPRALEAPAQAVRPTLATPPSNDMRDILREAHRANLKRTPDLLIRSATDIPENTVKAVINNSDLKIWRDRHITDQLKNQNGQILNEAGAAVRADSVRKLVRHAEVMAGGKLQNPEAIKFLGQKKALNELPLYILKKAYDDGVINTQDLQNTFGNNSNLVLERFKKMSATTSSAVNDKNISTIFDTDQKDFSSGFTDLRAAMSTALSNPKTATAVPVASASIMDSMKKFGKDAVDQNGLYYLERLGQTIRSSQQTIAKSLQSEGVPVQTANAIATNTNANLSNLSQYLGGKQVKDTTAATLQQSFAERDLSGSIAKQIGSSIAAEKTLIQKGIATKIAETSTDKTDLKSIQTDVRSAIKAIANPTSPGEIEKNVDKINQFYPGAQLRVTDEITSSDVAKTVERGQSVLETIDTMIKGGIDKNEAKNNPTGAQRKIEFQVNDAIIKVASGAVTSDNAFNTQLKGVAAKAPQSK